MENEEEDDRSEMADTAILDNNDEALRHGEALNDASADDAGTNDASTDVAGAIDASTDDVDAEVRNARKNARTLAAEQRRSEVEARKMQRDSVSFRGIDLDF